MSLKDVQENWDRLGHADPFWAVLTRSDKTRHRWGRDEFFETGRRDLASTIERLKEVGVRFRCGSVLDFGCGVGRLSQALCAYFSSVTGVDIAPSMIAVAQELNRHPNKCRYLLNSAADLSVFAPKSFDFVYARLVLQHMEPVYSKRYIQEFCRVLRMGGILVLQIPSHREIPQGCSRAENRLPAAALRARIRPYDPPVELMAAASFEVSVRLKNESSFVWPAVGQQGTNMYLLQLGNHWIDSAGTMVVRDDGRTPLPRDLHAGEAINVQLSMTAPDTPGNYVLELDMVQEGVTWFGDLGSPTWKSPIRTHKSPTHEPMQPSDNRLDELMEMHGVSRDEMVSLIHKGGGEVLSVDPDSVSGWISYSYYVRKVRMV